jgi:hypothetical protein
MILVMQAALQSLTDLNSEHETQGMLLYETCKGELFPCDGLAFAVLERSLNLLKGFHLLLANGGYTTGAGVLRMQLDNLLRFYGVMASGDPHGVANSMANGIQLRKLKDASGQKMTDQRLLELHDAKNPDIRRMYELSSGYIHLSVQHIQHFLLRSAKGEDQTRVFAIGDEDTHMEVSAKTSLVKAFTTVTRGVLSSIGGWVDARARVGTSADLRGRFTQSV